MIEELANRFTDTFYSGRWPGPLVPSVDRLSLTEAYRVQDRVAEMRVERGEAVVGYKVGCTSAAIRSQFGLTEPIAARLFRPHLFESGVELDLQAYVNCAIEPEMVFSLGRELSGVGLPDEQLLAAIDTVSAGIEIHNYRFWYDPPTSQELICAGGIHAGLVVGSDQVSPNELSFADERFTVQLDGVLVAEAPASEIMGGPLHSLRWLVEFLTGQGRTLPVGSLVIPGSPTALVAIQQETDLEVTVAGVGSVAASIRGVPTA